MNVQNAREIMSTKLTDDEGRVATVEAFAEIVVNVLNDMHIPVDQLKDPTKKRTPNGFPEAMARALNHAELTDGGPAEWNAKAVSKRYKAFQADGSLFPAIESALCGERAEQSEQATEKQEPSEHPEPAEQPETAEPEESIDSTLDLSERAEQSEHKEGPQSLPDGGVVLLPSELDQIAEHVTPIIQRIVQEAFDKMMTTVPNIPTVPNADTSDLPPEPASLKGTEKGGRRQTRQYEKLSCTVDSVLFELFRSECTERKLSAGRMLDALLWNHYGRPELSYQQADAEQRAKDRPKRQVKSK